MLVILSHCYGPQDPIGRITYGLIDGSGIAMAAFFFLSGLLVSQSLDNSSSRVNFLWKRFLRLYPAAVTAVLLAACLIGPCVTTLPLNAYFTHPLFYQYLHTCALVEIFFHLPGVFTHSPLGPSVNASLWSLSLEWKCYAGLLLLSFLNRNARRIVVYIGITLLLAAGLFYTRLESLGKQMVHPAFILHPYTHLALFFLIGNLCYTHARKIAIYAWWIPAIPVLGLLAGLTNTFPAALLLLLPALLLCCAVFGTRLVRIITPRPDLSYGFFVWGYPVEQLTVNYLHPSSPGLLFLLVILLTAPLAGLSWYCVESPALKNKKAFR